MVKYRFIQALLEEYRDIFPAVGIVGPRQVGKTTLVKNISRVKEGCPLKDGVKNYSLLDFCEVLKKEK